ncbi:hypothetical protein BDV40DRAFT_282059 [Aspergillus tamarii]|uniref:Uncharacterized protein n=1 Tax=Aspergillus tamarii TaxID=41984 RepID=A0A5N6UC41_ASPTM|nr:hypothetical protein BDV40DRAFT_282059 [Aspergillus tamarii]
MLFILYNSRKNIFFARHIITICISTVILLRYIKRFIGRYNLCLECGSYQAGKQLTIQSSAGQSIVIFFSFLFLIALDVPYFPILYLLHSCYRKL